MTKVVVILALVMAGGIMSAQGGKSAWDGVYTDQQAASGARVYEKECSSCHGAELRGEGFAPALVADAFAERWGTTNVDEFFIIIKGTMPADRPSALSDDAYVDIVAFLLKMNSYPAGQQALVKDRVALKQISFKKPA